MGFSGISIWNLLIILAIVVLLFGTKRIKSLGSDLGGMLKGFKDAMGDKNEEVKTAEPKVDAKIESTSAPLDTDTTTEKSSTQSK
jgi:sec-independent protein translocase protein TatA